MPKTDNEARWNARAGTKRHAPAPPVLTPAQRWAQCLVEFARLTGRDPTWVEINAPARYPAEYAAYVAAQG